MLNNPHTSTHFITGLRQRDRISSEYLPVKKARRSWMILAEEPILVLGVTGVSWVLLCCYCCYQDIKTRLMAVISWLTFPALKWENVWELPERSCGRTPVPRWEPLNTTQCRHHQSDIFFMHNTHTLTLYYTPHTIHLPSFLHRNLYAGSGRWPSADCLKSLVLVFY